jgi:Zinc-binding dehydrogenase
VRTLTDGLGAHSVLECVGTGDAIRAAITAVRPRGAVGRFGVPHHEAIPSAQPSLYANLSVSGGPAPARAYIEEFLPDVLEGRIEPGRVFDRVVDLDEVPDGYRAMNDREAIKVMVNTPRRRRVNACVKRWPRLPADRDGPVAASSSVTVKGADAVTSAGCVEQRFALELSRGSSQIDRQT